MILLRKSMVIPGKIYTSVLSDLPDSRSPKNGMALACDKNAVMSKDVDWWYGWYLLMTSTLRCENSLFNSSLLM